MKITSLLKDTFVYGITRYLSLFSALLLTPLYTRYFLKNEYGVLDIFNTWIGFASIIVPLGLIASILRMLPESKNDLQKERKTTNTIFIHLVIQSVVYLVIMFFLKEHFYKLYGISSEFDFIFYLSNVVLILQLFLNFNLSLLRIKFEKKKYLSVTLTNLFLLNILGFSFVYFLKMRIESFFIASFISNFIALSMAAFYNFKYWGFNFDISYSKRIFKYAIHILSAALLFKLASLIDRGIISHYDKSLDAMGDYSIALRIGNLITLFSSAFTIAWFPHAVHLKDEKGADAKFSKIHNFFFVVMIVFISLLFLFRYEIILVMAPNYFETYFLIPFVTYAALINGSVYFYSLGIHFTKKAKVISIAAVISIAVNVILSIMLVGQFGLYGVLVGTLVGFLIWVVIQYIYSQKYYKIGYDLKYPLYLVAITLASIFISYMLDYALAFPYYLSLIIKIIILITVVAVFVKKYLQELKNIILKKAF